MSLFFFIVALILYIYNYEITYEESDRINIVKFVAIIFVVFIHSYQTEGGFSNEVVDFNLPLWLQITENSISEIIARFAVPVFFLFSSILLFRKDRPYGITLKTKIKTLLIPYIFWNSLWIVIFIVLQNLSVTSTYFSGARKAILDRSFVEWLELYGIGAEYPLDYPLWFVRDLMVCVLLFPVIKCAVNKFPKVFLIIGIILTYIPFLTTFFKVSLAYFIIGCALVKLNFHLTVFDNYPMWIFYTLYGSGFLIASVFDNSYIRNTFIFMGIIFWFRLSKEINADLRMKKFFLDLSKYTFMIYAFHENTLTAVGKICLRLLPRNPVFFLSEYFFVPFFVIFICILTGFLVKKAVPKFYSFITGER